MKTSEGVLSCESEAIAQIGTLEDLGAISPEDAADEVSNVREACRNYIDLKDYATLQDLKDDLDTRLAELRAGA